MSAEEIAQYDLTSKMTPFLDRHLVFPMFVFLRDTQMYKTKDIDQAEVKLLEGTNMIDFLKERYDELEQEPPNGVEELEERREKVISDLSNDRSRVLDLLELLESDEDVKKLSQMKSIRDCVQEFKLAPDVIDHVLHYAKLQYGCGNYQFTFTVMKHLGSLLTDAEYLSTSQIASCKWGMLSCSILIPDFAAATATIVELDEFLENCRMSKKELLLQRTWLLHWTLFAIFKDEKPDVKLYEILLNEKSLVIISLACPHLFRYVGASLILNKRLKGQLKDVVRTMQQEASSYKDPIMRFLLALYSDIDFDQAQSELQQCALACQADFFLAERWAEFEENARLLIFETYCRIHQCINIGMIASRLNMGEEEAELWIVKLIQNAKLDARIDSEKSRVVMSKAPPSVYQQVIEKTKNVSFRSTMLLSNLETSEKERLAAGAA